MPRAKKTYRILSLDGGGMSKWAQDHEQGPAILSRTSWVCD